MLYSVKVKFQHPMEKKATKETYIVEADSVTEAEIRVAEDFKDSGLSITVSDVNETQFKKVIKREE